MEKENLTEEEVRLIIRDEFQELLASDRYIFHKLVQFLDGRNIQVGNSAGTKIGTEGGATGQKLGFFSATPVVEQTSGANLTNSVTVGGTTDTISDFSDLTTYSNSAAAIRNDIYQLARKLKQINDGLRSLGLFD